MARCGVDDPLEISLRPLGGGGEFQCDHASVLEQLETYVTNALSGEGGFFRDGPKDPLTFGSGARSTVLNRSGFGFTKLAIGICDGSFYYLGFPCLGPLPSVDSRGDHRCPRGVPRSREFLPSGAASSERCYGIEKVHHVGLGVGVGI